MKKLISISLFVCAAFITVSARANLLVDPGFEVNPLTTASNVLYNFELYQGQWGVEEATITGVDGLVTPASGVKMLRMTYSGSSATQGFQVADVCSYSMPIDKGIATVNLSALFDANVAGTTAHVDVWFFDAPDQWGNAIGVIYGVALELDDLPGTWQTASLSGSIPAYTRWLAIDVAYNNDSLGTYPYHPGYVDEAELTIVPEPATICLLGLGALGLLKKCRA